MEESTIRDFWNKHPCGDSMAGSLRAVHRGDYESFFDNYDRFRYSLESHIPACLDQLDLKGKRVLEIGLGQGADSEQIIRRGASWSGIDLTPEAVDRVRTRMVIRGLAYEQIVNGSALDLPFETASFDVVYSHGVLHHIPEILSAQKEIHRVLKPGGRLIAMLYAKWSLNYLLSICIARRIGLVAAMATGMKGGGPESKVSQHVANARQLGVWSYLQMRNFIHRNTDGPHNPYSKVYDRREAARDFPLFAIRKAHKEFMYAPPLPVRWLPLSHQLGWHLWLHMEPLPFAGIPG